jgi:hypothetical protein
MDCRAENRSSHRRPFRVRNDLPQWRNTDRPVNHSRSCNILAASSGRRGECARLVTNQFEGAADVLGDQLTRGIINTEWARAKAATVARRDFSSKAAPFYSAGLGLVGYLRNTNTNSRRKNRAATLVAQTIRRLLLSVINRNRNQSMAQTRVLHPTIYENRIAKPKIPRRPMRRPNSILSS